MASQKMEQYLLVVAVVLVALALVAFLLLVSPNPNG